MAGRAKEWICFILFRFLLPLVFLSATVFRFNGFSLIYGIFALINPLIGRPTHGSLARHTGRYLTAAVIICCLTLAAQVAFQSYIAISESKSNGNTSFLENCSELEQMLRQIGLQKINKSDVLSSVRIILPDVISCFFSVLVFIICHLLLKTSESPTTSADHSGETIRKRLFRAGAIAADILGNFLVIAFTGFCGITTPSILNSVYFICFLLIATVLACGVRLGFWFTIYRILILVYCGLHLVALYMRQFQFMEIAWREYFQNDTLVERILGLHQFITVDCSEPWILHIHDGVKWTEFLDVTALLCFYFLVAIEVRRRAASSSSEVEFAPLLSEDTLASTPEGASQLDDIASSRLESQGLIQSSSPTRSYRSMESREATARTDPSDIMAPVDTSTHRRKESTQFAALKYFTNTTVTFVMQQSYIATLVVMMAWSITYLSWLAFALLIAACLIWMIPQRCIVCLKCSPLIVFYAICLIIITYVYGFDLTNTELPDQSAGGYNLKDIGLIKYEYPVKPLAVQAAFICVFWINLYQFIMKSRSASLGTSRAEASSMETLEGAGEGDSDSLGQKKRNIQIVKAIIHWCFNLLCKYWIFACGALFLLIALQEAVIFRIVYMILFLCFVISFQLNYTFWRFIEKTFWFIVIIFSMVVLISIYVFQFEFIIERWQNATGMSSTLMHDFGFRKYDSTALFIELLTPTSFLIVIILHLHHFRKPFLAMSDVNRYKNDQRFENRSDADQAQATTSTDVAIPEKKPSNWQEKMAVLWLKCASYAQYLIIVIWRLLEIHVHKLILMSVFLVCVNDVCSVNILLVLLLVIFLLLGWKRLMSLTSMFLCSLIILVRMVYQLDLVNSDKFSINCTEMMNMNTSASGMPPPFNDTISNAGYLGLLKADSMSIYVRNYVILVLLFTFESIVVVHQKQFYNHPNHHRPPAGIVFPGILRAQADIDLINCVMFLVNYGFYKFGKEICFIMTVVTMVVRLDVFSVVYGFLLGFLLLLGRRKCRCLWPGYMILLAVLLVLQYLSCVGVPAGFCWQYPWIISPSKPELMKNLEIFLYLPDFLKPPDAKKLIADFFQLLFFCLQFRVFMEEVRPSAANEGGSNRSIAKEVCDVDSGKKRNPLEDFVSYKDSYLDYVKVGVFYYSFWITLLVLFFTGTNSISIFCLGYLVACFFFLWFGQDLLLKPIKTVQRMWTVVLVYSYIVILLKCCLQLVGCVYLNYINCVVVQLFNVVCLQSSVYTPIKTTDCHINVDNAGMSWDAASFAFLLFLIRIYKTWYFQHIVTDLHVDSNLASRGSEMINLRLYNRVAQAKLIESTILDKIKRKMERIKLRQYRLHPKSAASSNDHYVVIRSGDYYMFEDISDDELELATEASEDKIVEEEVAKKPGPIQIISAGIQSGPKVALEMWDHPSPSSPPPPTVEQEEVLSLSDDQKDGDAVDEKHLDTAMGSSGTTLEKIPSSPVKSSISKEEDTDRNDSLCDKFVSVIKLGLVVIRAFIVKVISFLNGLSSDYSFVSRKLKEEKTKYKHRMKRECGVESVASQSPLIESGDEEHVTRPSHIAIQVDDANNRSDGNEIEKQKQAEKTFHREMPLVFQLFVAAFEVIFSHSDLLCYFAMVLNVLMSGSIVSLVYPIATFLWALLSTPRPSKTFWVFVITYTEVLIIIKYVFQFAFIPWNSTQTHSRSEVFYAPYILGIEKKDAFAVFDILLLFSLFLHRSVLKQYGLWKDVNESQTDLENAELASRHVTPAASPHNRPKPSDIGGGGDATSSSSRVSYHDDNYQDVDDQDTIAVLPPETTAAAEEGDAEKEKRNDTNCCKQCLASIQRFYDQMTNRKYSAATDVYARIFFCDLITFIIVVFGYSSFGPGDSSDSGNALLNVATVIKQNKIPASFLGMMLAQFILMIIDRAIYLRKQILVKLIFQVLLVILVHVWMFFALPAITNRRFVDNVAAQLWYFTKCIYFGFSSYQIRCGYPTRILGNFLTKKYNYLNLFSFQGFLVIPFLLELRALMDWMFTDTTLALGSWLQMEDIYSNVFVIKCNRRAEKTYPVQRGQKRQAIVKYGLGGVILILLIFIIWFPLLLFSMSESIYTSNPPTSVTVEIRILGYEPLFTMTAQRSNLTAFNGSEYNEFAQLYSDLKIRSFLDLYRKEDIYKCRLLGLSAATWSITPPYMQRMKTQLLTGASSSIIFSLTFFRNPELNQKSEMVTGEFERVLDRRDQKDNDILNELATMLSSPTSSNWSDTIFSIFPRFVSVPASGKPSQVDYLFIGNPNNSNSFLSGNASLQLSIEDITGTRWWSVKEMIKNSSDDSLTIISFNERIAPAGVLSVLSSYGVIGLYVSLVLVVGRFVRMWIQGLSFKIMFVELPNPDILLKLCLDIYMVRENGELMLEEELFSQLIFLYRSPETLIKVTKYKVE